MDLVDYNMNFSKPHHLLRPMLCHYSIVDKYICC